MVFYAAPEHSHCGFCIINANGMITMKYSDSIIIYTKIAVRPNGVDYTSVV